MGFGIWDLGVELQDQMIRVKVHGLGSGLIAHQSTLHLLKLKTVSKALRVISVYIYIHAHTYVDIYIHIKIYIYIYKCI